MNKREILFFIGGTFLLQFAIFINSCNKGTCDFETLDIIFTAVGLIVIAVVFIFLVQSIIKYIKPKLPPYKKIAELEFELRKRDAFLDELGLSPKDLEGIKISPRTGTFYWENKPK